MSILKSFSLILVAVLLIFTGLSFYKVFYPFTLQYVIENKLMILQPESKFFKQWSNLDEPTKLQIYLFELTNARSFLLGKRPRMAEYGPFVFNHYKKVLNVTWLDGGKKISYYESSVYHFDRSDSIAGLDDYNLTVINLALMTTMNTMWKQTQSGLLGVFSPAVSTFLKSILSGNSEFITERRSPGQLLLGRRAYFMDRIESYLKLARSFGMTLDESPLSDMKRVGYFQFSNNSVSGPVVMHTGLRSFSEMVEEFVYHNRDNRWVQFYADLFGFWPSYNVEVAEDETVLEKLDQQLDRRFMKMVSYEDKKYYGKALRPNCNEIKGTDGSVNNNYLVREHKSLFLHSSLYRPMKLIYERKKSYSTINYGNEYVLDNETFASNRENWCFCPGVKAVRQRTANDQRTCTRNRRRGGITCRVVAPKNATVTYKITGDLQKCNGYHDMAVSNEYLPVAISFPHFMHAKRLQSAMDGLDPDYNDHRSYFDIEPHFGVTMEAKVKLQVNVQVHPSASVEGYNKFKPTLMPYLWMVEGGQMGLDTRSTLFNCVIAFYLGHGLCLLVSLFGVLIIAWLIFRCRKREGKADQFLDIANLKKKFSVRFSDNNDNQSIWSRNELLKSNLKKSKKIIVRNGNSSSSSSLNQILPSQEEWIYPEDRFEQSSRKSISLNSERFHSNRCSPRSNKVSCITPLG